MSSLFDSVEFFNKDALIEGKSTLPHMNSILDKKFWVDNLSNRFYASFNYLFPIACVLLIFLANLALFVLPNTLENEKVEIRPTHYLAFFSLLIIVACTAKGLKWLLPEKGYKIVSLQNDLILNDDKLYNEYLEEWRWNIWIFFISLLSFAVPIMLSAVVLSFIIYKLQKKQKRIGNQIISEV